MSTESRPRRITDYDDEHERNNIVEKAAAAAAAEFVVSEKAIDKNALAKLGEYGFNVKSTLRQLRRGEHTYATTAYELLKNKEGGVGARTTTTTTTTTTTPSSALVQQQG